MILFTGLTGAVGSEISRLAVENGIRARGLVRNPGKAEELRSTGFEVVCGDMSDTDALAQALGGVDTAFLLMANCAEQLELENQFTDIACGQGVTRLIKMSADSANTESPSLLQRIHGESEQYIQNSGLAWTHVRPGFFMQNMLHMAQTINTDDCFFLPMADGRVGMIDIRDVARFILKICTETGHEETIYEITGPELLSFEEVAAQLSEVLGRQICYVDVPPANFRESLRQWVPDDWYVEHVSAMFEQIATGCGAICTPTFEKVTGREPLTFRRFASDFAGVFSRQTG